VVERWTFNPGVVGSIPTIPIFLTECGVMVAFLIWVQKVMGSSPIIPKNKKNLGELAEWLDAFVLKTNIIVKLLWVQVPHSLYNTMIYNFYNFLNYYNNIRLSADIQEDNL
jgi:hypothetical protein